MSNCKTCVYRIFDPLWGVYKCRLKKSVIEDVDTIDCEQYKQGDPANTAPKKPNPLPPKPSAKFPTTSTPGSCTSCIYYLYDPVWAIHKCRLKKEELQNGIITNCPEYKKGCPKDYVEPKEPKPGPPSYIRITENGTYNASEDGIIGYNEIEVEVPVNVTEGEPYTGKYEVKPMIIEQTLPTKDKVMTDHVKVLAIPYYETTNHKNGKTVIIGD